MTGGVAHDFNNILFAVEGYVDLAEETLRITADPTATAKHLTAIRRASLRARELTNQIFTLTRSGLIDPRPVALAPIVDDVIALLAPDLPKSVTMRRTGDASVSVAGESAPLHQIVMNLTANAAKATPAGTIEIALERTRITALRSTRTGVLVPGAYVVMTIRDTGGGIDPSMLTRIFEPFFSASKSGTGLGMTIVTSNLKAHGGGLEIQSAIGQGTTARVFLPWMDASGGATPDAAPMHRGNGETVALVADDAAVLELLEDLVAQLGFEPVGFQNASDATRAFSAAPSRYDIVLVDHQIGDQNGLELVRELRARRPNLPAVLVTNSAHEGLERELEALSVIGPLPKPLVGVEVARALNAALRAAELATDRPIVSQ